jgi:hydrogenase expression/formation protein HypD
MIKHLEEYRDEQLVRNLLHEIHATARGKWNIMEICGGQTHALVKHGILELLPPGINMIHGPGCPVCVTPETVIDQALFLCREKGVILCTYGDMIRVPGTSTSLMSEKSRGADVRIVYSPLDALQVAVTHPDRDVVFLGVGFETTAPAHALAILQAHKMQTTNFSVLHAHVMVPPAIRAIMEDPDCVVDGFLAAGHVCAITGMKDYYDIAARYRVPITATGFEPADLLQGILYCIRNLENRTYGVDICYSRAVQAQGNMSARRIVERVFKTADKEWRGIGLIPQSGLEIKTEYEGWDAYKKFDLHPEKAADTECIAGMILKGIKKPPECPFFGTACTPVSPKGAPMVSSEGACAAYYQYQET